MLINKNHTRAQVHTLTHVRKLRNLLQLLIKWNKPEGPYGKDSRPFLKGFERVDQAEVAIRFQFTLLSLKADVK